MSDTYTLITGASAGIGREMAVQCAKRGFNLLLVSLPNDGLPQLASELADKYKLVVHYFETDLNEREAPEKLYDWCAGNHYVVDKLVNNVGIGADGAFEAKSLSEIHAIIQINNYIVTSVTNLFLPMLKRQPQAYVLNVSSAASYFNIPNKAVYAASKAFIKTFTHSLRNELQVTAAHVSVSLLCPGGSTHKIDKRIQNKMNSVFTNLVHETPQAIAEAGISGMLNKRKTILPGFVTNLYVIVSRILPGFVTDAIVHAIFKKKKKASEPKSHATRNVVVGVCLLIVIASFFLYFQNSETEAESGDVPASTTKSLSGSHSAVIEKVKPK